MRIIQIDGHIGKGGAEVKTTSGGVTYVKFSLANTRFSNGQEATDWFDVISYAQHLIDGASKLTQGSYVMVVGDDFSGDPRVDNSGKIWKNSTIRATSVFKINSGNGKKDDQPAVEEPTVSTYSGNTQEKIAQAAPAATPAPAAPVAAPEPVANVSISPEKDDLPF